MGFIFGLVQRFVHILSYRLRLLGTVITSTAVMVLVIVSALMMVTLSSLVVTIIMVNLSSVVVTFVVTLTVLSRRMLIAKGE